MHRPTPRQAVGWVGTARRALQGEAQDRRRDDPTRTHPGGRRRRRLRRRRRWWLRYHSTTVLAFHCTPHTSHICTCPGQAATTIAAATTAAAAEVATVSQHNCTGISLHAAHVSYMHVPWAGRDYDRGGYDRGRGRSRSPDRRRRSRSRSYDRDRRCGAPALSAHTVGLALATSCDLTVRVLWQPLLSGVVNSRFVCDELSDERIKPGCLACRDCC
jgi:hypothetical protein